MSADARALAREVAELKKAVRDLQTRADLGVSSIEGGTTEVYDDEGNLRQIIGQQSDGTFTVVDVNGPAAGAPSTPTVTPKPGLLVISWDGQMADGTDLPLDFARVEVHVDTTAGFTPSAATQKAAFASPKGGEVALVLDATEHYVVLVMENTSGVESPPSIEVAATPDAPITGSGGVETFVSDTAPVGLTADDEGDIWYDSANGMEPNRWDGTAWVSVRDTTIAAAQFDATQALNDAADANSAAQQAETAASNAQSAAAQAQSTADGAQSAADSAAADALNAANAADAAQSAADAAQATADAKGKVLIQSAAPAAADQLPQNLWIDTTGGANTPKKWDGAAWQPVTDKVAQDAADAAVAAQQAADSAQTRADDAFQKATDAAIEAGNATATANGKNTIWYQPTPPAGTGHKVNDMWFDEDDGNKAHKWDGTAWVGAPFGSGAVGADVMVVNDLFSREGYFGTVAAEQIDTGNLNATLALLGALLVGSAISIDGDNGIIITTPIGQTRFAADGSGNTLAGDLLAQSLTVLGQLAIRGTTNEISKGSSVTLSTGTTAPQSAPVISATWEEKTGLAEYSPRGFQNLRANQYVLASSLFNGGISRWYEDTDGFVGFADGVDITNDLGRSEVTNALGGVAVIGNDCYVLCGTNETIPGTFYARQYVYKIHNDATTGAWTYSGRWLYEPTTFLGGYSGYVPAIGTDGTSLFVAQCGKGGDMNISTYDTSGNLVTRFLPDNADGTHWSPKKNTTAVCYGTFDYDAPRWIVACDGQSTAKVIRDSDNTRVTAEDFPVRGNTRGMFWDQSTDGFRSTYGPDDLSGPVKVVEHTGILGEQPVSVVTTWRKADGTSPDFAQYETARSPIATFENWPLRKRLSVSTNPIPDDTGDPNDADSISIYVSRVAAPTTADFHREATPAVGVNSVDLSALAGTGGAPPSSTTFPVASPAIVESDASDGNGALLSLRGDGTARISELDLTAGATLSRIDFGVFSGTTDANGRVTIPHNLGVVPTTVLFSGGNNRAELYVERDGSTSSTEIGVQVRDGSGTNLVSTAVEINWLALA